MATQENAAVVVGSGYIWIGPNSGGVGTLFDRLLTEASKESPFLRRAYLHPRVQDDPHDHPTLYMSSINWDDAVGYLRRLRDVKADLETEDNQELFALAEEAGRNTLRRIYEGDEEHTQALSSDLTVQMRRLADRAHELGNLGISLTVEEQ